MSDKDYIEVDWYIGGVYFGKRKIGKNSICGKLIEGDLFGAVTGTLNLKQDIAHLKEPAPNDPPK